MILDALFYEGTLSVMLLIAYFYFEPKFNVPSKKFLSMYNACRMLIALPFAEFLYGFILQDKACLGQPLCYGTPDIFQHNLTYDIFFLRVNDTSNGAHWIDYMLLPIIFFLTFYLTRDAWFSALNAGFMVFLHEIIWFAFYWVEYYNIYQTEGWLNDIAFFLLVSMIGFIGFVKYRKWFVNAFFIGVAIPVYIFYLALWYVMDGLKVTVINNTALGSSTQFLITQWYNDLATNQWEVYGWILIFGLFTINLFWVKHFGRIEKNIL